MQAPRAASADVSFDRLFPRIHKVALGIAIGVPAAGATLLLTLFHVVFQPKALPLGLLSQFFYGYNETWGGAFIGAAWASGVGFAGGWLVGFVHNLNLDLWLMLVHARADLSQKRNALDHIR